MEWRAHTSGLANCLWELEKFETVSQACALAEMLLADDFDDSHNVRNFLLDLYLESGRWDAALELLHKYGTKLSGSRGTRQVRRLKPRNEDNLGMDSSTYQAETRRIEKEVVA
jgi:hypothetical protein